MKSRLKELRKALKLTQREFGEKIGVARNTIAQYEIGTFAPSNPVITSICKQYGVNEKWLRTGEGDMFVKSSYAEEIEAFLNNILTIDDEQFKKRLVVQLAQLDDAGWEVLEKFLSRAMESKLLAPIKPNEEEDSDSSDGSEDSEEKPETNNA